MDWISTANLALMIEDYLSLSLWLGQFLMSFQLVALLPSRASFPTIFLKVVVVVKSSGLSHFLELWLGVSKGMLPVRYFCFTQPLLCVSQISWRSYDILQRWAKSDYPQFFAYYRIWHSGVCLSVCVDMCCMMGHIGSCLVACQMAI